MAQRVVDAGVGQRLDKQTFTTQQVKSAVSLFLHPSASLTASLVRVQSLVKMAGGVSRAVDLIQHAHEFGVDELTPLEAHYPGFALYSLDVFAVYLVTLCVLWYLTRCFCCTCRTPTKQKAQ